jgi:fucose 4-O-acetylase-like acetyltransferase
MMQREFYIDRLRAVLTALVILHHCAITYGATGGWFYHERNFDGSPSSLLLTLLTATQQAYFMGFFFLLAGYFTPGSLDRKGYAKFIGDRLLRLGLPLLGFVLLLAPLTVGMADAAHGDSFWGTVAWLWTHRRVINGPLWFAQALLIFSLVYCGWRAMRGIPARRALEATSVPSFFWWLLSAAGVGAVALAIRQFVPTGESVFGLQLGYFSSYIFLFALGIAAWRHDWLRQLSWKNVRPWLLIALLVWPLMPVSMVIALKTMGASKANFGGGLGWPAMVYAFWEPFLAWGTIATLLLVFRRWMNRPSALWGWLSRRAYAVYVIHPPVLVGAALLMRGWVAPPLIKFGVVGLLACVACWLLADALVRLPGLRRVL